MEDDHYLPLHQACHDMNPRKVGRLLWAGVNVNECDSHGTAPLTLAVKRGATAVVFQLLEHEPRPNLDAKDVFGKTALYYAVENNDDCVTMHLLARNADPNVSDSLGATPLIVASKRGYMPIVVRLLGHCRTQVDLPDYNVSTALWHAADNGRSDIVTALVLRRANVNVPNCMGKTPVMVAAEKGHTRIVNTLIDRAARLDHTDKHGFTAIQYACNNGHADVVRLLAREGAYVHLRDPVDQSTLLITAAKKGHEAIARFLVTEMHLNVNSSDCAHRTALYYACRFNIIFDFLLEHNASPHEVDRSNKTVLMRASQLGNVEACRKLVERGVNQDYIDSSGNTALTYACIYGKRDVTALLLDHGAMANVSDEEGQTPLMLAVFFGHEEVVSLLLQRHAMAKTDIGIDYSDKYGVTALHRACTRGHAAIAQKLLASGASPRSSDAQGITALMLACDYGHEQVVRHMLTFEAQAKHLEAVDERHQTALIYACKLESIGCLDALLQHGANPNTGTERGVRPLMMAACMGSMDILVRLVESGASLDEQDDAGRTALYWACDTEKTEAALFLLARGAMQALRHVLSEREREEALLRLEPEMLGEGGVWGSLRKRACAYEDRDMRACKCSAGAAGVSHRISNQIHKRKGDGPPALTTTLI